MVHGSFAPGLAVEEEDVRLHALGVEDAGRQAQQRVDVALVEQLAADGLAGAALEEHVVGHDDGGAAVDLEQRLDVLDEVELLVRGRRPEVGPVVGERLLSVSPSSLTTVIDDFLPNGGLVRTTSAWTDGSLRRESSVAIGGSRVVVVGADAVQEQVHGAQAGDAVDELDAAQRLEAQVLLLVAVELVVLAEVVVGGEQEAAGAAGRVADDLARLAAGRSRRWPR